MFWFLTTSNKARLHDPTEAARILAKYWFDFECDTLIEQDADGQHRLSFSGDGWPGAWLLPDGVSKDDHYPDFDMPEEEGFAEFLIDIAPCLADTLIVQAIGTATGEFPLAAVEWRIEPGSTTVAKTEFTSSVENASPQVLARA
jgi:hypothetical protein